MLDFIYEVFARIGYNHPIHPTQVHMPIGLLTGTFFLGWTALLLRRQILKLSARHCLILALIFFFPTVLLGFMDWQHYYAGAWLFPIKIKLALAGILLVLLVTGIILTRNAGVGYKSTLTIYTLCFLTVVGLGYFGGELVYGGRGPAGPRELKAGEKLFTANCGSCHPHGGNILDPNLPLRSASQLTEFNTFVAFIRTPKFPDGSPGPMPPFPPSKISDQQGRELYEYITKVLANPKGK
ncbi:MAG: c-type cytochrome [Promethearchaeota archaeon]